MIKHLLPMALLGLVACNVARAQETPIEGLAMGQSEGVATAAIDAACDGVARIEIAATRCTIRRL